MKKDTIMNEVELSPHAILSKSNYIITAMYELNLVGQQLLDICLANAKTGTFQNEQTGVQVDTIYACITSDFIMKKLSRSKNVLELLKPIADKMTDLKMLISNEKGEFAYYNLLQSASYKNGVFMVTFNIELGQYILNLKKNYTQFDVDVIASFKKLTSLRLYEFLRSGMYSKNKTDDVYSMTFEKSFSIPALAFSIGIANPSNPEIQEIMKKNNKKKNNQAQVFEEAYQKALEIKERELSLEKNKSSDSIKYYADASSLRKYVISPSVAEINKKTDIDVEFEPIKIGREHKIVGFRFISRFKPVEVEETVAEPESYIDADECMELLAQNYYPARLNMKEITTLCRAAENNVVKIKQAIEYEKTQKDIANLGGWFRNAIKEGYKIKEKSNSFNKFEKTNYDFDELEDALLSGGIREIKDDSNFPSFEQLSLLNESK